MFNARDNLLVGSDDVGAVACVARPVRRKMAGALCLTCSQEHGCKRSRSIHR